MLSSAHTKGAHPLLLLIDASNIGGIERHVQSLAHTFHSSRFAPQIVLLKHYQTNLWRQGLSAQNLPFVELDGRFSSLLRFVKTARSNSASPIVMHTHGYKAGIMGRLAAKACSVACLSSFHAGETAPFPVNFYQWLDVNTSFLSTRIAVSEGILNKLPKSSHLVPNGVNMPNEQPNTPAAVKRIAFVGRASFEKAPDLFCQLAKSLANQGFVFSLYGDGEMLAALKTDYSDYVDFKGMVQNMPSHWSEIDLLLLPSRAEGLPMAALEAMSYGVLLLASTVGDLPKLIEHGKTGWLFATGDSGAMQAQLEAICAMQATERQAVQKAAQTHIAQNYSLDATIAKLETLYLAAIKQPTA
jgi:glycosyltransferase involved in cell wall biosynthesis